MAPIRRRKRRSPDEQKLGFDYSRFSTGYQSSIPSQQSTNHRTEAKHGIRNVGSFCDKGLSRSMSDRPDLMRMWAEFKAHPEVGYLTVPELERLTAGVTQRAEVKEMCQELRITIVTAKTMLDPFNDADMLEADQNSVDSDREVSKGRGRTVQTMKSKVLDEGLVTMRPTYGVRSVPMLGPDGISLPPGVKVVDAKGRAVRTGRIELHPDEHPWLIKIFTWAGDDLLTLQQICDRLKEHGVPTKTGKSDWAAKTVQGIIENAFFKGEMTWGKRKTMRPIVGKKFVEERDLDDDDRVTVDSPLGAVIDPDLWLRANIAIKEHQEPRRQRGKRKFPPQVFDGFVYCARCGHRMYGRSDGNLAYGTPGRTFAWRYCCTSPHRPNVERKCAKAWTLSEKKILAALATLGDEDATAAVRPRGVVSERIVAQALERRLAELAAKRERQGHLYEDGIISREEMRRRRDEIDAETADARAGTPGLGAADPSAISMLDLSGWSELVQLLADKAIPVADRAAALRHAGVRRLYLDGPVVEVEPIGGNAGFDGGLLGLQDSGRLMNAQ